MKVTENGPDLLILSFTRWKGPVFLGGVSLVALAIGALIANNPEHDVLTLIYWLVVTVIWTIPMSLALVERSMLVLNASTGNATLSHRTIRGLHKKTWPLNEVQSTRITRRYSRSPTPATKDPKRLITLYVRTGMDEGRHKIANRPVRAAEALEASALISDWMKDWRKRQALDSPPPQA